MKIWRRAYRGYFDLTDWFKRHYKIVLFIVLYLISMVISAQLWYKPGDGHKFLQLLKPIGEYDSIYDEYLAYAKDIAKRESSYEYNKVYMYEFENANVELVKYNDDTIIITVTSESATSYSIIGSTNHYVRLSYNVVEDTFEVENTIRELIIFTLIGACLYAGFFIAILLYAIIYFIFL